MNIPQSYTIERENYLLPSSLKRLGVISDVHIPYHNVDALTSAFEHFYKTGVDSILINGDFIDFYQLSKFSRDPRKRSFKDELDITRSMLDEIKSEFPNVKIYFKVGNHEERYMHYLMSKAPEIFGNIEFDLDILLQLRSKGIEYITDKRIIKAGGLSILHGHELNIKSISVNPARALFLKVGVSAMIGHLHTPSFHSGKRLDGHIVGCWSTGHLGEESPDYAPYNGWQSGFAIVNLDGKEFEVSNFKIINNKVYRT